MRSNEVMCCVNPVLGRTARRRSGTTVAATL